MKFIKIVLSISIGIVALSITSCYRHFRTAESYYHSPPANAKRKKANSRSNYSSKPSNKQKTVPSGNYSLGQADQNISSRPSVNAGSLTATEINDFGKWKLWQDLSKDELSQQQLFWKIKPQNRYSVLVKSHSGKIVINAIVKLTDKNGKILSEAKTDNLGKAELWGTTSSDKTNVAKLIISNNEEDIIIPNPSTFYDGINIVTIKQECQSLNQVDLLFAVDATGSMDDEIDFLKADLTNIISKVKNYDNTIDLKLGSLFYRCEGNDYVTKHSPFTSDINKTLEFIQAQSAAQGGEEVVEQALEESLSLKWRPNAKTRLLFLVLDESPRSSSNIMQKYNRVVLKAAKMGIKIIPIVSSGMGTGLDKKLEYLMRTTALITNGTSVFLTDHSGIGNSHTAPSTDEYDVVKLNELIPQIIQKYMYYPSCTLNPTINQPDTTIIYHPKIIAHEKGNVFSNQSTDTKESIDTVKNINTVIRTTIDSSLVVTEPNDSITIKDIEFERFEFYPNPTKGIINISLEGKAKELFLCDLSGKILKRITVDDSEVKQYDLSYLPTGTYLLKAMVGDSFVNGKIVLIN